MYFYGVSQIMLKTTSTLHQVPTDDGGYVFMASPNHARNKAHYAKYPPTIKNGIGERIITFSITKLTQNCCFNKTSKLRPFY